MRLRMKNFNIIEVHWKNPIFRVCMKNQYIGGQLAEKGGLDSLQI